MSSRGYGASQKGIFRTCRLLDELMRETHRRFAIFLNRSTAIDSEFSLDTGNGTADSGFMIPQQFQLYIERIDARKNMARYYMLSIQPTLFGEPSLTRCWGRIGSRGQQKIHLFRDEKEAIRLFLEILARKRKKGYLARSICGNHGDRARVAALPE